MKILIVEDDFVSRRILQKYLSPLGICEMAVNGREALSAFSLAWEEGEPYRLIFLDIMMPEMDGKEVLKSIRSMEMEKKVPEQDRAKIVMTTALNDPTNVLEAIKSQCNDYLVKPIEKKKLLEKLRKLGY
ncbi:MAG TPA: response regulator [Thermodesulfobacteriota bacterium]|nr:response regulator [Thermodesulfobacteriota bacterium]